MKDNVLAISIPDLIAIALLLGSFASIYLSLLNKINTLESNTKHLSYALELAKERNHQFEFLANSISANISRIDKSFELHIQQVISDKDAALSHRHSLQELIEHRSKRWESELAKIELGLKQDIAGLSDESYRAVHAINRQLSDVSGFLIKRSDFNDRKTDSNDHLEEKG